MRLRGPTCHSGGGDPVWHRKGRTRRGIQDVGRVGGGASAMRPRKEDSSPPCKPAHACV